MDNFLEAAFDDDDTKRQRYISCLRGNFFEVDSLWRLAETIYICARKWGEGVQRCESALLTFEETLVGVSLSIQSFHYAFQEIRKESEMYFYAPRDEILNGFRSEILGCIPQAMWKLCEVLSDGPLQISPSSPIEIEEALFHMDCVFPIWLAAEGNSTFPCRVSMLENLRENLRFLKNFTLFVASHGVEDRGMMGVLLIHVQGLVFDVANYLCKKILSFGCPSGDSSDYNQLIVRIEPVRSHVCSIYVGALQEASKLSQSFDHSNLLAEFVDSLLFLLSKLLTRSGGRLIRVYRQQMLRLHERLRFLSTSLRQEHREVDNLDERARIRVLICEAGIITFSLHLQSSEEEGGNLVEKIELLFSDFHEKFEVTKVTEEDGPRFPLKFVSCVPQFPLKFASCVPQTNLLGFIDSVLEKLESVSLYEIHSSVATSQNDQMFQSFRDHLAFIRSFLVDVVEECNQNEKLQTFWKCIAAVAYETEFILDSMVLGGAPQRFGILLQNIIGEIKLIQTKSSEYFDSTGQITQVIQNSTKIDQGKLPLSELADGFEVGLDDEAQTIIDRLTRGTKNLDVVSIVGMPGLGKTTLAKRVYRHLSIMHHFDARSWCTVSQVFKKKSFLLELLSCLKNDSANENLEAMSVDDLANALRKSLKGKRYLIALDDVWDIEAWRNLENSFPNDAKGSRILLTSRQEDVALQIKRQSEPHHLRSLTDNESWELFQNRIRFEKDCSLELLARGKAIAQRCKGSPLMILIIAGILSNMEPGQWEEVEESLNKSTTSMCQETLDLSYRHLPEYLKPCFLYFSAFQEDQQINVRELVWQWIAEGFVVAKSRRDRIEDVADGYIRELIQRNLVMIAKTGSSGRIKYCVLHDLLHNFCTEKASKDYFLHHLQGQEADNSTEPSMLYRLSVYSGRLEDFREPMLIYPRLRTLMCNVEHLEGESKNARGEWKGILFRFFQSKLLRVLEIRHVGDLFFMFPSVIQLLLHLKYLALTTKNFSNCIPPSFANLSNLETFVVYGTTGGRGDEIELPNTLGNMTKLKHLCTRDAMWVLPLENPEHLSNLKNLQYLSTVKCSSLQTMRNVIRNFANIRKLKCELHADEDDEGRVDLEIVSVESLNICAFPLQCPLRFPQNLKKLTLSWLMLPWTEISPIYRLPNLEVLKLEWQSFTGEIWDMPEYEEEEETFPNLRFLKLEALELRKWMVESNENFPRLEKLVLFGCYFLEELPACLAKSSTLEMIEVYTCQGAADPTKELAEMKEEYGNESLKILVTVYK